MIGETLRVPTGDGTEFLVSKSDWESEKIIEVKSHLFYKKRPCEIAWQASARSHTTYIKATLHSHFEIRLHRLILNAKVGDIVDHIDGNGTNNISENLRIVTPEQNSRNRRVSVGRKFKGVYFQSKQKKYSAHIRVNGVKRHLGTYETDVQAASSYDAAAKKYFGEFAVLNFPSETSK